MLRSWISFCTLVGTVLLLGTITLIIYPPSRIHPAQLLYRGDTLVKGEDAIILFMGDALDRAPQAAALYKKGFAKKIVFVETEFTRLQEIGLKPPEGQLTYEYLTSFLKVPAQDIIFQPKSRVTSSVEEVKELNKIIEKQGFSRVILTTSWYHSRRVAWIYSRYATNKSVVAISGPSPIPAEWYRSEVNFLNVFDEYVKWLHNGANYIVLYLF